MSFRFVVASVLGLSAFGLHAQDPRIRSSLERCIPQSLTNHQAFRSCVSSDWNQMLRDETQKVGQRVGQCEKSRSNDQSTFNQQMGRAQKDFQQQMVRAENDCSLRIKNLMSKQPDIAAVTNSAILADRQMRRNNGIDAIDRFFKTFEASSKTVERDIETYQWNGLAGTLLVRRKGAPSAVLLVFPSLARALPQENNTQLRFECSLESKNCVMLLSRDGGITSSAFVVFTVSATDSATLVERAELAIQAFK